VPTAGTGPHRQLVGGRGLSRRGVVGRAVMPRSFAVSSGRSPDGWMTDHAGCMVLGGHGYSAGRCPGERIAWRRTGGQGARETSGPATWGVIDTLGANG
jgi:hypothetical protein